jgi:DNA segregation ATPase FtsK/SpoIIIE, S-DNA-T family
VILRLTVQDINSRKIGDIELNASPDDWVGALLSALPGVSQGDACFVGAAMLDPSTRLAGSPLLPGAVLSVGGAGPDYQPVRGAAAGTLHVIEGPDAGFGVALRPGRYFIGRSPDSHVSLHDVDVSRTHALVEVSAEGRAVIVDAGSRNGTWVNRARAGVPTALDDGSLARLGEDTLRWAPGGVRTLRVLQTADGRLAFDRALAAPPAIPVRDVDAPPREPPPRSLAVMATSGLAGLAAGPALFAGTRHPVTLLASLAGPAAWLVTYAIEGRGRGKEKRASAEARTAASERVAALVADEERVRHLLAPGPAEVTAMAAGARPDLWARDARSPHGLVLRVGVTDQAPSVRLRGAPGDDLEVPDLRGVPVTVDLREAGVFGVIGAGEPARALLRWLVVQLATLRSPDDLRLVLLTAGDDGPDPGIAWTRWLPHLDGGSTTEAPCLIGNTDATRAARVAELGNLILTRMEQHAGQDRPVPCAGFRGDVVVVIDGALALRNLPGLGDILKFGPEAGVYLLCADEQGMAECRGVCELPTSTDITADGLRLIRGPDSEPVTGTPDGMDRARAEQVARALAPMRDRVPAAAQAAIPYPVRLLDLLGIGAPSAQDILALWTGKRAGPTTRVVLGADASGPVTVDLAAQGPHTVIGGAAGAGKSVLLRTLVTSLLLANRPDELNLVLVDGTGDGTFLPFENCPHVTALIPSTGEAAADTPGEADTARVLAALRAEVRHREAILSGYGAEIDIYWRAREIQPALPRLPRVVVIFDEFARVPDASQDLLKELVDVAARGRPLGVHLVLATQSPGGKLPPELKDNIALRISLRQNEAADSVEVLGTPEAITIPSALPGRGMILSTTGEPRTPRPFQSGCLGDPPLGRSVAPLTVRPLAWADLGVARPAAAARAGGGPTDQDLVTQAIEEAARHLRRHPGGR